ncbi:MAG: hypothetical protein R2867_46335 [Caldilineaceae bacterium]
MARAYFAAQGETHVYELRGFVIMAYQPQGTTGFYDSRVLYVTFHESLEERPEYVAWVDLSHETVRKAFQEQWSNDETTGATGSTRGGTVMARYVSSTFLFFLVLLSPLLPQASRPIMAQSTATAGVVDWNGWAFSYEVSGSYDGLSLLDVYYSNVCATS